MNRSHPTWLRSILLAAGATAAVAVHAAPSCEATPQAEVGGKGVQAFKLAEGGHAAWSAMHINIDGYGRAYHRNNRQAGAVLHLCVGGEVVLPDGTRYHGSASQAICTGRFMADLALIEAAGWADPSVRVVRWYGVVAEGQVQGAGRTVKGVEPVPQRDGSGFYVSPTSLVDPTITDLADQRRYANPLRVAAAVAPGALLRAGVKQGSFGVVIRSDKRIAVPFVVGDAGPRIGEGTPALARRAAGLAPTDEISLANRRVIGQRKHDAGHHDPADSCDEGPADCAAHRRRGSFANVGRQLDRSELRTLRPYRRGQVGRRLGGLQRRWRCGPPTTARHDRAARAGGREPRALCGSGC